MAELTSKREMLLGLKGSQIKFGDSLPTDLTGYADGDVFINRQTWEVYNYDVETKTLKFQGKFTPSEATTAISYDELLDILV